MIYGAVIIAAGHSDRMDQLRRHVKAGDSVIAERVIVNFLSAGVRNIVIVAGNNADQLEKDLKGVELKAGRTGSDAETSKGLPRFVKILRSGAESSEMFDAVKLGIKGFDGKCDRVFICPLGVPFFSAATLSEEMRSMDSAPSAKVVVPVCEGKGGHPILLDNSVFEGIFSYAGEGGLRGFCDTLPDGSVVKAEVPDEGSVTNADTGDEIYDLMDRHNDRLLHPDVRLTFNSTSKFFGPGTVMLLREIEKCGNVREACANCGFSYSKGWTIIRKCEGRFGWKIVERQAGGSSGGKAAVTDKGKDLLAAYDQLQKELSDLAEERFRTIMKEYDLIGGQK